MIKYEAVFYDRHNGLRLNVLTCTRATNYQAVGIAIAEDLKTVICLTEDDKDVAIDLANVELLEIRKVVDHA